MAALDFPASPSNGQTYTGPGGVVWYLAWLAEGNTPDPAPEPAA